MNNSYVKVSIDKRNGRVIDLVRQIWDNVNSSKNYRKRSEEDFEKELVSDVKDLNNLYSLLENDEADVNWDDVKVEQIDDESFRIDNVPYSSDNTAVVRHIYFKGFTFKNVHSLYIKLHCHSNNIKLFL